MDSRETALSGLFVVVVLVLDLFEVGVDDIVFGRCIGLGVGIGCLVLAGLIHGLTQLHRDLGERAGLFLDQIGIFAFKRRFGVGDGRFDFRLDFGGDLVAVLGKRFLGRMHEAFGLVFRFHGFAAPLV